MKDPRNNVVAPIIQPLFDCSRFPLGGEGGGSRESRGTLEDVAEKTASEAAPAQTDAAESAATSDNAPAENAPEVAPAEHAAESVEPADQMVAEAGPESGATAQAEAAPESGAKPAGTSVTNMCFGVFNHN